MNLELLNLCLFALFLAKLSLYCGFAPAVVTILLYQQVSGRAVSYRNSVVLSDGNKPVREVMARAA